MVLSVDEFLDRIGSFGRYQVRLVGMLCYMYCFNFAIQVMLLTFVAAEPAWHCVANSTVCTLAGEFRPGDDNYDFRCGGNVTRADWEFSDSFTSIVTEFELVCGASVLGTVANSMVFAGWPVGALLGGFLSDRWGRHPVLIVSMWLTAVFGTISASPPVYWFFVLCRFLVGIGVGAGCIGLAVMATEFVGVRHRHVSCNSLWFAWTAALMLIAGLAYAMRDWRLLTLACSIPGLVSICFWWFIPESTRYLLVRGQTDKVEALLRKIATVNGKEYPDESVEQPPPQRTGDFRDLFRTRAMLYQTLITWYMWVANTLVYYGVSYSAPNLGQNAYLNFFLTSIIEAPGAVAAIWAMGRLGRKKSVIIGFACAFVASVGAVLLTMHDPGDSTGFYAGTVFMAMTAKFFVTISFGTIIVYTAELFPTVIRNVGVGTCNAAARIGAFSAPYVIYLYQVHPLIPYSIMGINALVASLLCLTLPETKGMSTKETLGTNVGQEMIGDVKRKAVSPVSSKKGEPKVVDQGSATEERV